LVHVPRAGGVAGLAEDQVEGGAVGVAEAGGESLGGAEGATGLPDGGEVAALGLRAGAGGHAEEETGQQGCVGEDGVLDVQGEGASLLPCGEVARSVGVSQAAQHDGGEEVVPCGVSGGQPAGRRVGDELLLDAVSLAPGVELPEVGGLGCVGAQVLDFGEVRALRERR
jgi:hypothetical protein